MPMRAGHLEEHDSLCSGSQSRVVWIAAHIGMISVSFRHSKLDDHRPALAQHRRAIVTVC